MDGWSRALTSSLRYASLRIHLRAHQRVLTMCILAQWHSVASGAAVATRHLRCAQGLRHWCLHALARHSRTTHAMRLLLPRRLAAARTLRRLRALCRVARSQRRESAARVVAATNVRTIRLAKSWERWRARAGECAVARLLRSAMREKAVATASRLSFRRLRSAAAAEQVCSIAIHKASGDRASAFATLQRCRRRCALGLLQAACRAQSRLGRAARDRASAFAKLQLWRKQSGMRRLRAACLAVSQRGQRLAEALRQLRRRLLRCWLMHAADLAAHSSDCASAAKAVNRLRKQRALLLMQRQGAIRHVALAVRARGAALSRRRALRSWCDLAADAHSEARLTEDLLLRLSAQRRGGSRNGGNKAPFTRHQHARAEPHGRLHVNSPLAQAHGLAALSRVWRRLLSCLASRRHHIELAHCTLLRALGLHRRTRATACLRQWAARAARRAAVLSRARRSRLSGLRIGLSRWCRARERSDAAASRALLARVHADLSTLRRVWRELGVAGALLTSRRMRLARARASFLREGSACRVQFDRSSPHRYPTDRLCDPKRDRERERSARQLDTHGEAWRRTGAPLSTLSPF
jgi:hypothetical protein